jgi:hypothetical protein
MSRGSLILALGLSAAVSGASQQAWADEVTISVLGLEPAAGTPDAVATAVSEALRQRVSATSGYRLVPGRDLVEVKLVFSCPDEAPPCMTQAAQSIGATKLVFGGLQPVGTDAYLVTLKLLDANRGVVEGWSSEQITKDQSTPAALRGPAQKWFAALTGQAAPGAIKIEGGVLGASVWLNGAQAGLLGADGLLLGAVPAGSHILVVSKSGYEKFERTVTVSAGATEKVTVELKPIETPSETALEPPPVTAEAPPRFVTPDTAPAATGPHQGDRIAAWALLGAGIVSIGLGAYSSYQVSVVNSNLDPLRRYPCNSDGAITCDPSGKEDRGIRTPEEEAYVRDQKDKGDMYTKIQWVGYGLGGALVATSAVFFYRGYLAAPAASSARRRPGTLVVMPSLGPGRAGAVALLRF